MSPPRPLASIDVVLFDLGGVLIELGGTEELGQLVGEESPEELWRRWLACPWVRRFERGHCDARDFSKGMIESWGIDLSSDAFLETFTAWPKGLYPGAADLVASLEGRARRACLSNTNRLHAQIEWSGGDIAGLFDSCFFSYEMGLVKPDREAFDYAIEGLDCSADSILFLDDNAINVEAARAAGLRAEVTRGLDEARTVLAAYGLGDEEGT